MRLTLEDFLPYRLSRLSEAVSNEIRPIYKSAFGLNRPEWRVLVALADIGPATAKDIGLHSAQHKTKVSRAVRALELRRWVRRETDPNDRRSEFLTLTRAGQGAYEKLVEPMRVREQAILSRLAPDDRAAFERGLRAIEKAVGVAQRPRR